MIAAFGRRVVKEGGFDPTTAAALRQLFELRNAADYSWLDTPAVDEVDVPGLARAFVDSVAAWLSDRQT